MSAIHWFPHWLHSATAASQRSLVRTVEHDLPDEIDLLRRQDEAQSRIMEVVDMPNRLVQDLLVFMRQNGGEIPRRPRKKELAALSNNEAEQIEAIYSDVFE